MNYTNFEVSMIDVENDSVNGDGDGFALEGSYELNDCFHLFGEWQDQSLDFGIDGRSLELGGGYTHSFSDKLDFVGTLSYVDAEVKQSNLTFDDDGLAVGGGIRSRVAESIELDASLKLVDFDESGSETGHCSAASLLQPQHGDRRKCRLQLQRRHAERCRLLLGVQRATDAS